MKLRSFLPASLLTAALLSAPLMGAVKKRVLGELITATN